MLLYLCCVLANNTGMNKRQITDLVDQSIQINSQCFVVTADNRYVLVCGFWDKSFRVYSSETGKYTDTHIHVYVQCVYSLLSSNFDVQRDNLICHFFLLFDHLINCFLLALKLKIFFFMNICVKKIVLD